MSRPRTAIRRMWDHHDHISSIRGESRPVHMWTAKSPPPVLVIPDNPAARAAMVERVLSVSADSSHDLDASIVEFILATALTPSRP